MASASRAATASASGVAMETASASGVEAPTDEHAAHEESKDSSTDKSKSCKFQNNFYLITMHQQNSLGVVT